MSASKTEKEEKMAGIAAQVQAAFQAGRIEEAVVLLRDAVRADMALVNTAAFCDLIRTPFGDLLMDVNNALVNELLEKKP